jgi:hypothetical protein
MRDAIRHRRIDKMFSIQPAPLISRVDEHVPVPAMFNRRQPIPGPKIFQRSAFPHITTPTQYHLRPAQTVQRFISPRGLHRHLLPAKHIRKLLRQRMIFSVFPPQHPQLPKHRRLRKKCRQLGRWHHREASQVEKTSAGNHSTHQPISPEAHRHLPLHPHCSKRDPPRKHQPSQPQLPFLRQIHRRPAMRSLPDKIR